MNVEAIREQNFEEQARQYYAIKAELNRLRWALFEAEQGFRKLDEHGYADDCAEALLAEDTQ